MDALDERVLRDDEAVAELRSVVRDPGDELRALELREEPELTELAEPQGPITSTGPEPAPTR